MNAMISVIIPAFNAEKYLYRCVSSVVAQTYRNLEIILVDDGSVDKTRTIAEDLAVMDNRIVVIHQNNQGVSAARNVGLALANGDCIGFVDADDEIMPDMYEHLLANMNKYGADISHCGFEHQRPDKVVKFHDSGVVLVQNGYDALKELLSGKLVEPSACTKLYKKSTISKVLFPNDIKINEDLFFNIEVFRNARTVVFEDIIKYRYILNHTSASRNTRSLEKSKDCFDVAVRIKKLLIEEQISREVNQFYVGKLLANLKSLKSAGLFNSSLAELHRKELRETNTQNMGIRIKILKGLLLDFPFFYDGAVFFYNLLFSKNQKWK